MSVITYDLLLADKATDGSIRNWVRSDAIPPLTILRMAENSIYQRLRIRQMLERSVPATSVLAVGDSSITVPDRLLAVRSLRIMIPYDYALQAVSFEDLQHFFNRDPDGALQLSAPENYSFLGGTIFLDCQASEQLTYELVGIYALPPLSRENPTNYLTDQAISILMMTCAGLANEYMNEPDESQRWLGMAAAEIDRHNVTHSMGQRNTFQAVRVA